MKRYYLSPIIGSGTEVDPFRPKIADFGVSWSGVIASDPVTGAPARNWCLILVEAADHAALIADADLFDLPNINLNALVSSLSPTLRNRLSNRLDQLGINRQALTIADALRVWLRAIGRHLEPSFHEDRFSIR